MPYEKLDNQEIQNAIGLARQLNAVPPEMRGQSVSSAPTSISEDFGRMAGQAVAAAPDWLRAGADPNKIESAVTFGTQILPPFAAEQALTDTERGNYGSAALNASGAVPGGKLVAPLMVKAMALLPKQVGSGLAGLIDDAVRMSKEEFLAKNSVEVTPEKLKSGQLPAQKVHDYVDPVNVDPSEYNMWGDTDLTTGKGGEKVRGMMDTLASGKEMPPVILRGTPDDPGFRPMVMEGHHRTMAHLLKSEPLPVIYDDKTLGELWDRIHKQNGGRVHKEGGGVAISQDQIDQGIIAANQSLQELRGAKQAVRDDAASNQSWGDWAKQAGQSLYGMKDIGLFHDIVPGAIESAKQAVTMPYRQQMAAASGQPWNEQQQIGEAFNTAGMLTLGAGAIPMEANSLRAGAGFFSKAKYVAENLPVDVMEKQQALGMLRNAGVSPDELKWTNLDARLSEPGKITKPELVKLIQDNDIKLKNIVQSDDYMEKIADIDPSPEVYYRFENMIWKTEMAIGDAKRRIYELDAKYAAGEFDNNMKDYLDKKRVFQRHLDETYKNHDEIIKKMQIAEAEKQGMYGGVPQYEPYALKGGRNYRESLMQVERPQYGAFDLDTNEDLLGGKRFWTADEAEAAVKNAGINRDYSLGWPLNEWPYKSPHFNQTDIVAHTRGQSFDVVDPITGKQERVWNIDESQSDKGQAARKYGVEEYEGQVPVEFINTITKPVNEINNLKNDIQQLWDNFQNGRMDILDYQKNKRLLENELADAEYNLQNDFEIPRHKLDDIVYLVSVKDKIDPAMFNKGMEEVLEGTRTQAVSPGPYIGSTKKWTGLNVRKSIIDAYENDADWLTFTPGEVQAERYNMRNHVQKIEYIKRGNRYELAAINKNGSYVDFPKKTYSGSELDDVFGKDVADQIRNQEGSAKTYEGTTIRTLNPEDFKFGGEGHIKYYRDIYAKEVKNAFKELGVKVDLETKAVPVINKNNQKVDLPVIGVRMTPEIRAALKARMEKYGGYFQQMANGGKVDGSFINKALQIAAEASV